MSTKLTRKSNMLLMGDAVALWKPATYENALERIILLVRERAAADTGAPHVSARRRPTRYRAVAGVGNGEAAAGG